MLKVGKTRFESFLHFEFDAAIKPTSMACAKRRGDIITCGRPPLLPEPIKKKAGVIQYFFTILVSPKSFSKSGQILKKSFRS